MWTLVSSSSCLLLLLRNLEYRQDFAQSCFLFSVLLGSESIQWESFLDGVKGVGAKCLSLLISFVFLIGGNISIVHLIASALYVLESRQKCRACAIFSNGIDLLFQVSVRFVPSRIFPLCIYRFHFCGRFICCDQKCRFILRGISPPSLECSALHSVLHLARFHLANFQYLPKEHDFYFSLLLLLS